MLPSNTHKQLVVIDFEYASANTPGLEFANHFTEWCYNYHDPNTAWKCNTEAYPTLEEQDRFARAYVRHRPQFNVSTPQLGPQDSSSSRPSTPGKRPPGPSSSISNFMLDARTPASSESLHAAEVESTKAEDAEVATLLHETRLWRLANSAQWVAWGIVQAKVPGLPEFSDSVSEELTPKAAGAAADAGGDDDDVSKVTISASPEQIVTPADESGDQLAASASASASAEPAPASAGETPAAETPTPDAEIEAMRTDIASKRPDPVEENDEAEEEEFDYLAYARDRAMFFWGDAVGLGIVGLDELPEDVRRGIKMMGY